MIVEMDVSVNQCIGLSEGTGFVSVRTVAETVCGVVEGC